MKKNQAFRMLLIIAIAGTAIFLALFTFGLPKKTRITAISNGEGLSPYLNIHLSFSRMPAVEMIRSHIQITPEVDVMISQHKNQVLITSTTPLPYGEQILLTISPFTDSANHIKLSNNFAASFTVRTPRVAAITGDGNSILIIDDKMVQETLYTGTSLTELAVSYSGQWISWVETDPSNHSKLSAMNLDTGEMVNICANQFCSDPIAAPIEESLLYSLYRSESQQTELHLFSLLNQSDQLLVTVNGKIEEPPIWSPDGTQFAWYSNQDLTVQVYNRETSTVRSFPKEEVTLGAWSPNEDVIFIRHTHRNVTNTYAHLCQLDLFTGEYQPIEHPDLLDGQYSPPTILPSQNILVFARQSVARENTKQIWQYDLNTLTVTQITAEPSFTHARYSYDLSGRYLLFQRLNLSLSDALPEIWYWDRITGEFRHIASGAALPVWLP